MSAPRKQRPTSQPTTDKAEIADHGFSEAMATYHERMALPLDEWSPHRPERPPKSGLAKPLKAVSAYEPAGDQPQAIKELTAGITAEDWDQVLLGATGTGKTFTMAKVIEACQRPALILAPNKTLAAQLYGEFKAFFPDNAVEYFVSYYDYYQPEAYVPRTDTYIEKESSINEQIDRMRHAATRALLERDDVVIIASVSCIYGIGSVETYTAMTFSIKLGEEIERKKLLADLVALQYRRNDNAFARGCFRARGDVIEIFPAHYEDRAWRISMFGDEIEAITEFDPLTGQKTGELEQVTLYANSHYVTPRPTLQQAMTSIKQELNETLPLMREEGRLLEAQRLEQRVQFDLEMMAATGACAGIENYSRYLTGRKPGEPPPTLFEYLPENAIIFCDESHVSVPQIGAMFRGDFNRKRTLAEYGFRLPSCMDNRPLKFEEWEKMRPQTIHVSATPGSWELERTGGVFVEQVIRPTGLVDPEVEVRPVTGETTNQVDDVIAECKTVAKDGGRVLVTTLTKRMAEDLTEYMHEQGIRVRYMHSDIDTLERIEIIRDLRLGAFDVLVGINLLREGLDIPNAALSRSLTPTRKVFCVPKRRLCRPLAARREMSMAALFFMRTGLPAPWNAPWTRPRAGGTNRSPTIKPMGSRPRASKPRSLTSRPPTMKAPKPPPARPLSAIAALRPPAPAMLGLPKTPPSLPARPATISKNTSSISKKKCARPRPISNLRTRRVFAMKSNASKRSNSPSRMIRSPSNTKSTIASAKVLTGASKSPKAPFQISAANPKARANAGRDNIYRQRAQAQIQERLYDQALINHHRRFCLRLSRLRQ